MTRANVGGLTTLVRASTALVKIYISSRDNTDIKLELQEVPNLHIDARNGADIKRFVRSNVMDSFREEIIFTIESGANGM